MFFIGSFAVALSAAAHEDIVRQIRALDSQIAATPRNADLLLKRADLHRRHQEWGPAVSDLDAAAAAGTAHGAVVLARARLELERGRPDASLAVIDRTSWADGIPAAARLTRARAHSALGHHEQADGDFHLALEKLSDARPDYYIEWANAVAARGVQSLPRAIEILDAGAARFQDAVTLHERAVEFERRAGRLDTAVRRVERILRSPAASIRWRVVRADLLAEAGRPVEAAAGYRAAAAEMSRLPARRKSTAAMQRLAREIELRLNGLSAAHRPGQTSPAAPARPPEISSATAH